MNDKLNLFFEYLTVELGLASNTRLAYERDLRLFKEALGWQLYRVSRLFAI